MHEPQQQKTIESKIRLILGDIKPPFHQYDKVLREADTAVKAIFELIPENFLANLLMQALKSREVKEDAYLRAIDYKPAGFKGSTSEMRKEGADYLVSINKTLSFMLNQLSTISDSDKRVDIEELGNYVTLAPIVDFDLNPIASRLLINFGITVKVEDSTIGTFFSVEDFRLCDTEILFSRILESAQTYLEKLAIEKREKIEIKFPIDCKAHEKVIKLISQLPSILFVRLDLSPSIHAGNRHYLGYLGGIVNKLVTYKVEHDEQLREIMKQLKSQVKGEASPSLLTDKQQQSSQKKGSGIFFGPLTRLNRSQSGDGDLKETETPHEKFNGLITKLSTHQKYLLLSSLLIEAYAVIAGLAGVRRCILQNINTTHVKPDVKSGISRVEVKDGLSIFRKHIIESPRTSFIANSPPKLLAHTGSPRADGEDDSGRSIYQISWEKRSEEAIESQIVMYQDHCENIVRALDTIYLLLQSLQTLASRTSGSHHWQKIREKGACLMGDLITSKLGVSALITKLKEPLPQMNTAELAAVIPSSKTM
jgi:hypothetical protein